MNCRELIRNRAREEAEIIPKEMKPPVSTAESAGRARRPLVERPASRAESVDGFFGQYGFGFSLVSTANVSR